MTERDPLQIVLSRLGRAVHAMQYSDGLNPAQWEALRFLTSANRQSATPGGMAAYLNATKGTVSQTLIALEQKGLVQRVRCDQDRRVVRLALTDAGQAMLDRDPLNHISQAVDGIDGQSRDDLVRNLDGLLRNICLRDSGGNFGKCAACCHLNDDPESPKCGMNGEWLAGDDLEKICVDFCERN